MSGSGGQLPEFHESQFGSRGDDTLTTEDIEFARYDVLHLQGFVTIAVVYENAYSIGPPVAPPVERPFVLSSRRVQVADGSGWCHQELVARSEKRRYVRRPLQAHFRIVVFEENPLVGPTLGRPDELTTPVGGITDPAAVIGHPVVQPVLEHASAHLMQRTSRLAEKVMEDPEVIRELIDQSDGHTVASGRLVIGHLLTDGKPIPGSLEIDRTPVGEPYPCSPVATGPGHLDHPVPEDGPPPVNVPELPDPPELELDLQNPEPPEPELRDEPIERPEWSPFWAYRGSWDELLDGLPDPVPEPDPPSLRARRCEAVCGYHEKSLREIDQEVRDLELQEHTLDAEGTRRLAGLRDTRGRSRRRYALCQLVICREAVTIADLVGFVHEEVFGDAESELRLPMAHYQGIDFDGVFASRGQPCGDALAMVRLIESELERLRRAQRDAERRLGLVNAQESTPEQQADLDHAYQRARELKALVSELHELRDEARFLLESCEQASDDSAASPRTGFGRYPGFGRHQGIRRHRGFRRGIDLSQPPVVRRSIEGLADLLDDDEAADGLERSSGGRSRADDEREPPVGGAFSPDAAAGAPRGALAWVGLRFIFPMLLAAAALVLVMLLLWQPWGSSSSGSGAAVVDSGVRAQDGPEDRAVGVIGNNTTVELIEEDPTDGLAGVDNTTVELIEEDEPGPVRSPVRIPIAIVPLGPDEGGPVVVFFVDPDGGLSWSILGTPGQVFAPTSIEEWWVAVVIWSNPMLLALFNNSAFPCGAVTEDYRVTCPLGAAELSADDEYFVIGVEHAGPVGVGADSFTYGLAFDDDGDESDNYQFAPPFTADFFRNTEHWYQLHIDVDGTRRMWADGARDGTLGHPRFSSALVIETGDTIVWVIPRSEIPGDQPAFRVTAFHDNGDPGAVPNPETSGGDVSGEGVLEPLIPIDGEPVVFDNLAAVPPDIDTPIVRVDPPADPDAWIAEVLTRELEGRLNAALAEGDVDAVAATVHPALMGGPNAEACRSEVEATIALADTIEFTTYPGPPDTSSPLALYAAVAQIRYPTGAVDWGPLMTPGPQGRFFLVLPSCA